jgi:hypothetical protein
MTILPIGVKGISTRMLFWSLKHRIDLIYYSVIEEYINHSSYQKYHNLQWTLLFVLPSTKM